MSVLSSIYKFVVKVTTGKCEDCGSDVEGSYINHPTMGTVKSCCAKASK